MTSTTAIKRQENRWRHDPQQPLLAIDEPPPYAVVNPDGRSPYLLVCEHASNRIPRALGDLGLPESERQRHIAWDIGVSALSQYLSQALDAPLFMANYSRLVIDCNRPLGVPSAIPEISETTTVPGNLDLSAEEKAHRVDVLFKPFADAISRRLDLRQAEGKRTLVVGIHSFTPVYFGNRRPWQAGILYRDAVPFARSLIASLSADPELTVGDNEPYHIHPDEDYTVPVHADERGLPGALIEVRHDLIDTLEGVRKWGVRLTHCLETALEECAE
ncbi:MULTISPECIES: N-formylglutamate amidohydrolase [unclassified Rhizobium]|jgi:predicted N-formylglutamate amidohydrolase|uniref:N-formylglutamate amidohydrolase n=1 Tax=unclassified Rhizobium TaxID=2613769 RepID=UPI000646B7C6|nr:MULTISPECIES: N-formylglutamate amidohydrolase [unclassified Rhizobium]MBN8954503.1 N-formylglutamate amidohydrolase [Rhizobium tropici]OJY66717.1 MAG: N-formylglutamate amidohydrolase [Rhizobium sp. 60-20]RKD72752.1 putative N-formylglutamate amidohydrolase [Rhizobium sp. WW_1]